MENNEENLEKKQGKEVEIIVKTYPTAYKNRKGNYIGDSIIQIKKKELPFSSFDQVDFYLNNLSKIYRNEDKDLDKQKESSELIPSFEQRLKYIPIKEIEKKRGGRRKTQHKSKPKKKSKRTTKKKGNKSTLRNV